MFCEFGFSLLDGCVLGVFLFVSYYNCWWFGELTLFVVVLVGGLFWVFGGLFGVGVSAVGGLIWWFLGVVLVD